ncbi:hypothetical protein, partial [Phaeocystidibacter marisrubri]|uniref:hypothetical protein n=1 Tax=Phaeocystidibacter marisrubri TaxID=1577780 RepID=UPI00147961EE
NGRYKDMKSESMYKMALYLNGQLTEVFYSFYNDDLKYKHAPQKIVAGMLKRLIYSGKCTNFNLIIFYKNRMTYPHDIEMMFAKDKSGSLVRVQGTRQQKALEYYCIP